MRIEFCEADVLDAFDDWRRAVGVARVVPDSAGGPDVEEPQPGARPRKSLASQIESALARLTVMRGSDKAGPRFGAALDAAVRAARCAAARSRARARRGPRRADAAACRRSKSELADAGDRVARRRRSASRSRRKPTRSSSRFATRMPDDAYRQSRRQSLQRLVRQHFGLPSF